MVSQADPYFLAISTAWFVVKANKFIKMKTRFSLDQCSSELGWNISNL